MGVLIEKRRINDIPLLEVCQENDAEKRLPAVFFIHGFTSAKEHNLHYGYLLAEKGFRVILPEVIDHGERNDGKSVEEMTLQFWNMILSTIHELEGLKQYYVESGKIDEDKIGLAGTSMGAIITLGALSKYEWIQCAASLMGNPCYESFARYLVKGAGDRGVEIPYTSEQLEAVYKQLEPFDLSRQPEKLNQRPLFFWHGKKDPVVPYEFAYRFYEKARDLYVDFPDRLYFLLDEQAEHHVSREGLLRTVSWFETHLKNA